MKHYLSFFFIVVSLLMLVFISACSSDKNTDTFYTWQGIGPDKWASVWLIERHINPESKVNFIPVKTNLTEDTPHIAFDIPSATLRRTNDSTTFQKLTDQYAVHDPIIAKLGRIISDIEINSWGIKEEPESQIVESGFRGLQIQWGRDQVAKECYLNFFDHVYKQLLQGLSTKKLAKQLTVSRICDQNKVTTSKEEVSKKFIPELPIATVLKFMSAGDKVIFVDARETPEFNEYHIPDSKNLKLREVNSQTAQSYQHADLVIAYCVKDFRGYELAKALKKEGVRNVAIMNPFGIKGWRSLGLPVVGTHALSAQQANLKLSSCLKDIEKCLLSN